MAKNKILEIYNKIFSYLVKRVNDKILHFSVCFVVTIVSLASMTPFNVVFANISAFTNVTFLSFWKEFKDEKDYGGFSWGDILADYLGMIAGFVVFYLILFLVTLCA